MRVRTKLFLTWGSLVILLWAATLWSVRNAVSANFDRVAGAAFTGTKRSVTILQNERVKRMEQACWMVMNIPELRALIAEHNYEVSEDNTKSLEERLDGLTQIVGVSFVCVLDNKGNLIAQNHGSPWQSLGDLRSFLAQSPEASSLMKQVFKDAVQPADGGSGAYGLWMKNGQLLQVFGVPLVFRADDDDASREPDGALVMATPINDELAAELSKGHGCELTFLADHAIAASSIAKGSRDQLLSEYRNGNWPTDTPFEAPLGDASYRSSLEPLIDPSSGSTIGAMLIQSNMADALAAQSRISRQLLAILATGLGGAAIGSFVLSGLLTRSISELLTGVKKVAGGAMELTLPARSRDELGELAIAFNEMVIQLRSRRELERLVEESRAASRAKSQFLANVSHEIRTPLNGVVGVAELMLKTDLNDRQRRYAGLIKSSGDLLTTLINDVLDFSKIEAGKMELEAISMNLVVVAEDVVEMLAPKAHQKGLELICDASSDLPVSVIGDPNRLRQILINLINNAIKFTETGHVGVRLNCEERREDGLLVRFEITDTGVGIPADRMDKLFKSFSQVDASTTRRYGGTGLGLAISKQLAELMGGTIGVQKPSGTGSTFWFTAVLGTDSNQVVSAHCSTEFKGLRVLIAEAHAVTRESLQRRLEGWGINATSVDSGEQAIKVMTEAAAAGVPFSIALVSDQVSGITGLEVGALLQRRLPDSVTRMLLLTRTNEEVSTSQLQQAGFSGYITKPVRRSQLIDALQSTATPMLSGPKVATISSRPGISPRHAARILLAEDHEVNQIVVKDLLASAGFECDVVADGLQAVEAAMSKQYDLILMDCQMPGIDGFEATRRIRSREQLDVSSGDRKSVRSTPIVALTANATPGDRQSCLDAGMNAYCTKPINSKYLFETIVSLLNVPEALPAGNASPPEKPVMAPVRPETVGAPPLPPLDLESLLRRCSGKSQLVQRVLEKLSQQADAAVTSIRESLNAGGDAEKIIKIAHGLKGAAGMASAENLRRAAAAMEQLARVESLQIDDLEQAFTVLRDEVMRCNQFVTGSALNEARAAQM